MLQGILSALCLVLLLSCTPKSTQEPVRAPAFERLSAEALPRFEDDLDPASLRLAIEKSLTFYNRVPEDRTYPLGDMPVSAGVLKASLLHFLKLLETGSLNTASIARDFDVYQARQPEADKPALVTGYYEPILEGRIKRDETFAYPLYKMPPDIVIVDLPSFNPKRFSSNERLVGRMEKNRVVPYYTRAEIDGQKKLEHWGGQLVWLRDPVEVFFLHVQGSGMIRLAEGQTMRVGFAGANGRPYRSLGNYLIEKGYMAAQDVSLQSIRDYLKAHPKVRDEALWSNESYVFFRTVEDGPVGSLNVSLTAGRSIATDPQLHPRGALAFLEAQKPRLDDQGQVIGWEPLQRWVLNQDEGGAIKGMGRADLFCGSGESAEAVAGRLKHPGKLYILVKKQASQP